MPIPPKYEAALPDRELSNGRRSGGSIEIPTQPPAVKLDPLLYEFEMPLRATYYPLGFALEIATNSHEVLAAADESWGHFRKVFPESPLQLRIGVVDSVPAGCLAEPVVRAQGSVLARVADAQNFSVSDMNRGFAFAWLTRATVENRAYLRWHFIEGISWDLLDRYLTPVHAACLRLEDHGVLLCGDDGVGKSSLAYACARRGWTYVADDSCCLVRGRQSRTVVGNPYQFRFRESAVELFPELKNERVTRRAVGEKVGEMAIELPTANLPGIRTATQCQIDYIVFLNRRATGSVRISRFPKNTALRWLEQVICCGEKETVEAHKASLRRLVIAEIFELRYADLDSAKQHLEILVRGGNPSPSRVCTVKSPENA